RDSISNRATCELHILTSDYVCKPVRPKAEAGSDGRKGPSAQSALSDHHQSGSNAPRRMAYLFYLGSAIARVMSPSPCSARHGGGDKHSLLATSNARLTADPVQKLRS